MRATGRGPVRACPSVESPSRSLSRVIGPGPAAGPGDLSMIKLALQRRSGGGAKNWGQSVRVVQDNLQGESQGHQRPLESHLMETTSVPANYGRSATQCFCLWGKISMSRRQVSTTLPINQCDQRSKKESQMYTSSTKENLSPRNFPSAPATPQ